MLASSIWTLELYDLENQLYVYVYIYLYINIYTHTHTHTHTYIYTPYNDVSVNEGRHIRRWYHNII